MSLPTQNQRGGVIYVTSSQHLRVQGDGRSVCFGTDSEIPPTPPVTSLIAGALGVSASVYEAAPDGATVQITADEWDLLRTNANSGLAGQLDSPNLYTTAKDWNDYGLAMLSSTRRSDGLLRSGTAKVPGGMYVFAFRIKTGPAAANRKYAVGLCDVIPETGLPSANLGARYPLVTALPGAFGVNNSANEILYFVVKGGLFANTDKDMVVYGGTWTYKNDINFTSWYNFGGPDTTTSIANLNPYDDHVFMQALYAPSI